MKKTTFFKNVGLLLLLATSFCMQAQQQKMSNTPSTLFGQQVNPANVHPENGIIRCATVEYEKALQAADPKRFTDAEFEAWIQPLIERYRQDQTLSSQANGIITIPVVVHVIHNGQPIGTAPNITDAQVQSQITVMNNDFRRMAGTPGFNNSPVGADTMIQFALAKQDPNGNPTNGINRVNLCQPSWSQADINAIVKPGTIWDPALYMNMWSVNFSNATLLGYAQFPNASGLPGLNFSGGAANTDGVVANYSTFGSVNYNDGTFLLNAPYNEGRTMTHEVGHWLGLRHIWGDDACASDFCADTPTHHGANFGCPDVIACNSTTVQEMVENYMDYSDDACMNIYTQNQKDRMIVIMNNAARRSSLKTSTKDLPMDLFANDAEIKLEPSCAGGGSATCGSPAPSVKLSIYNRGTATLTSASISYTINGGAPAVYNWTGNLTTHKFATFDMPITATGNGTISVSVVNANGAADQRASNNTVSGPFTLPTGAPDYAFTTYTFRLQRDRYGAETQWNIKNAAGTILYSGGPYTNTATLPALLTQTWTLPTNDCYTFTMTDAENDGICCAWGAGYYDLKNGATTIFSGGEFGATVSHTFSINYLATDNFENNADIYAYPNPSKTHLTISVPGELGLPKNMTITNYLGQVVKKKAIGSQDDLTIGTSELSNGVYFLTIEKEGSKKTLRFIKE